MALQNPLSDLVPDATEESVVEEGARVATTLRVLMRTERHDPTAYIKMAYEENVRILRSNGFTVRGKEDSIIYEVSWPLKRAPKSDEINALSYVIVKL